MTTTSIAHEADALRKITLQAKTSIDRRRQQNRYLKATDSQIALRLVKAFDMLVRDNLIPLAVRINRTQQVGQTVPTTLLSDIETLSSRFASLRDKAQDLKLSPTLLRASANASLTGTTDQITRFPYDSVFDDVAAPPPSGRKMRKVNVGRSKNAERARAAALAWLNAPRIPRIKSAALAARPDFVRGDGGELIMLETDSDTDDD